MSNSKRLDFLLQVTAADKADSFTWYALALEYKGLARIEDALATFHQLRQRDPDYVPMYLMCGTMLIEAARRDDAKEWLATGLVAARKKGDTHAAGEIEGALAGL
ncbi:MAG TPA: tetratricopeptide repeat protein [Polyangiaceae bacterium]|jgi:predicted Zn-dependent protease|nr:tetratricopeptide repeat protein [Polyangiaceae bacterium]